MRNLNRKPVAVKYRVDYIEDFAKKSIFVFAPEMEWEFAREIAKANLKKQGKDVVVTEASRVYA